MYREQSVAPVNVGEELELTVEAVGAKGDGIAKVKGFVLFIAGTKQGEHVKVRVTKVLKNVGFAEVLSRSAAPIKEANTSDEEPQEEAQQAAEEDSAYEDSENFGEE